jgi:glycosyltransferase involved in cell wall biosynthesis
LSVPRNAGASDGTPSITVVIPTFQRKTLVRRAVESLDHQTIPPAAYEVVVVVDGSTDGSADALRALETRMPLAVVEQANSGKGAACNRGARMAGAAVVLFLDDDMRADPRMLEEHLLAYRELDADAVMGLIGHDPSSPRNIISEDVRREFEHDLREWGDALEPVPPEQSLVGAQLSVRREVFLSVGGFDEAFTRRGNYGGMDHELGVRLRSGGARIVRNGRARSLQTFIRNFDAVVRQYEGYGQAAVRLHRKHAEDRWRPWELPEGGVARRIALATVRHPGASRTMGRLALPGIRWLYDRGSDGRLTRKLTYTFLFHHCYWLGVAEAGGGPGIDVSDASQGA